MTDDTLQYVSELLNTSPELIRQLMLGQAHVVPVNPDHHMPDNVKSGHKTC